MWIGRLGQLSAARALGVASASAAATPTAKHMAVRPRILLLRTLRGVVSACRQRADAAGKTQDTRPAFPFDLFGVEAEGRNPAIDSQAIAGLRPIERRCDAKDLASPFSQRNGKAAFLAELHFRKCPPLDSVGLVRTFRFHARHISIKLVLAIQRQQRASD